MANLAYQQIKVTGTAVAYTAADAAGDTVPVNPRGVLLVRNDDASAHNVTLVVPGNTAFGQAEPDVTITVAAGATEAIGPFPQALADPTDGLVHVSYAAVTSVTVAALSL